MSTSRLAQRENRSKEGYGHLPAADMMEVAPPATAPTALSSANLARKPPMRDWMLY